MDRLAAVAGKRPPHPSHREAKAAAWPVPEHCADAPSLVATVAAQIGFFRTRVAHRNATLTAYACRDVL